MSDNAAPAAGTVGWVDLTVAEAPRLRDFYAEVVGWQPVPVEMGGYQDYSMMNAAGTGVAGVCHARGANADLPPVWLVYFVVPSLDAALAACAARGGEVVAGPRGAGPSARFAVLRDPAGAAFALYEPAAG
jgi:predicted enzyme related to lactoylglutathione lyase